MFGSTGLMRSGGMVADGLRAELARLREELAALKAAMTGGMAKPSEAALRASAAEKIAQGAPLTKHEAAAFLGMSARQVQRMRADGKLLGCSGYGQVVRFAVRDVLRLASAQGKER